jgi:hypothetical protein
MRRGNEKTGAGLTACGIRLDLKIKDKSHKTKGKRKKEKGKRGKAL